ncbi:MAG: hypothetical protein K5695_10510 [Oscillospiraceae bacterium]|nr:hypothetical protein [Oscillospiraceae bacterium]
MKRIGRTMNILMAVTLSLFLSFTGTFTSGNFTLPGFIVSFIASTIVSLIIGLVIPIKPISDKIAEKAHLQPRTFGRRCMDALVSDVLYTPILTLLMVGLAYFMASRHGSPIPVPFILMFLKSFAISMIVGFILAYIFQPLYLGMLIKKYGVPVPPANENGGAPHGDRPQG